MVNDVKKGPKKEYGYSKFFLYINNIVDVDDGFHFTKVSTFWMRVRLIDATKTFTLYFRYK